jgi:kinesin family member C2/C3
METFNIGLRSRKVQSTQMNDTSSRSHLILGLVVETKNNATGEVSKGKISFVDLAGSERLSKSNPNVNVDRLRESNAINLSLESLGKVIAHLSNGNVSKAHIPYRDNKLTHLMKDSLGGNSKTLMFVNISPADYNVQETQNSLQFGTRVKMVQNDAQRNSESETVQSLRHENEMLK